MELPLVLRIYQFWVGFGPIFKVRFFSPCILIKLKLKKGTRFPEKLETYSKRKMGWAVFVHCLILLCSRLHGRGCLLVQKIRSSLPTSFVLVSCWCRLICREETFSSFPRRQSVWDSGDRGKLQVKEVVFSVGAVIKAFCRTHRDPTLLWLFSFSFLLFFFSL